MPDDTIYGKRERVRKPRVHISYDVETEDGKERRELPFVVGVVGDFSGDPTAKLKPLADREFVQIDRDNFDDVLARMKPGLNLRVENTLQGDGSEFGLQLKFEKMEDFEPGRVVQQVEPLRKLMETRNKLKDLQGRIQSSPDFEEELGKVLKSDNSIKTLAENLGGSGNPPKT